ncbi:MAG: SDR family NAD(P)-dependent oxidoreductase, partial [Flavobacteriaceae bacterium]
MRLKNKVILVTGAYTGIGNAIAQACVNEGAKVVANGLQEDLEEKVVAQLGVKNAVHVTMDITDAKAPQILMATALDTFGKLDAVVN